MSDVRFGKIDLITTKEINLHGRKHTNSADAEAPQDLVTLSQLKAAIAAVPPAPDAKSLPKDLAKIDAENKFTSSQDITPTDSTKPALIIHEYPGGQPGSIFVIVDSSGSTILSIKGLGATPTKNDTILNGPITCLNVMPVGDNLYILGSPVKTWKQIDGYIVEALSWFQCLGSPGLSGSISYVKFPSNLQGTLTFKGGILTGST
jgi:hypothetical protein